MMPTSELIAEMRTRAMAMEYSQRFLVLEMANRLEMATKDVVPVVRCKDCKHYHTHNRSVKWNTESMYCCKSALKKVCPDDFCSYGERREGE